MRLSAIMLVAVVVSACAIPKAREFRAWDRGAYDAAGSGSILWSDYYARRFEKLKSAPSLIAAKGIQMQQALKLREVALDVESGKRPMHELTAAQKQAEADVQVEIDREDAAMSAAAASRPPPKMTVCRPAGSTVICN